MILYPRAAYTILRASLFGRVDQKTLTGNIVVRLDTPHPAAVAQLIRVGGGLSNPAQPRSPPGRELLLTQPKVSVRKRQETNW